MKTDWHRVEYAGTTHEILLDIFAYSAESGQPFQRKLDT